MFCLLKDLDTTKYTHRTYVVSSGDAFSAQRAVGFEKALEEREKERQAGVKKEEVKNGGEGVEIKITSASGTTQSQRRRAGTVSEPRPPSLGPDHYNIAVIPRARAIHQTLLTTPLSCVRTILSCFAPLLRSPPLLLNQVPTTPHEAAAADLPELILTNGPATAVIMILASLILRFFDVRGANSRGKCRTVYVESFARVKTLSLSGKILVRIVDRFLVQWEELKGAGGGRAEFCGVLV